MLAHVEANIFIWNQNPNVVYDQEKHEFKMLSVINCSELKKIIHWSTVADDMSNWPRFLAGKKHFLDLIELNWLWLNQIWLKTATFLSQKPFSSFLGWTQNSDWLQQEWKIWMFANLYTLEIWQPAAKLSIANTFLEIISKLQDFS
jgi:hypothetical protein